MEAWLVFKQDTDRKPHQMVGSVNAADAEMALLQARTVFARRPKAVGLWVVPKARVLMQTQEEATHAASAEFESTSANAPMWQVFRKVGQRRAMNFVAHVGEVSADSAESALHTAIATFSDNKETWVWMVVPTAQIVASDPTDAPGWFEPALTKTYKQQSSYGFVGLTRQGRSRSKRQRGSVVIDNSLIEPLIARLISFADDELILAHRNSEWVGHGPMLEEDIAIANVAQDELGHAMLLYGMVEALGGKSGDQLAFFRRADQFRNVQFVELPKGDWAFTILRQYLFDAYQHLLYDALAHSSYQPLADAAIKIRKEELYHLRHTHAWVHRLGLGSAEANRRMQAALDVLWSLTAQLFLPLAGDGTLVSAEIIPDVTALRRGWENIVRPHLQESELTLPADGPAPLSRSEHTQHLTDLLADMQLVARTDPDASW